MKFIQIGSYYFTSGECYFNYLEKQIENPNYKMGETPASDLYIEKLKNKVLIFIILFTMIWSVFVFTFISYRFFSKYINQNLVIIISIIILALHMNGVQKFVLHKINLLKKN